MIGPESGPRDEIIANPMGEIVKQSQELYNWLGLDVNLQKELEEGNIILPSDEQSEAAKDNGYGLGLVIPSNLSRSEIIRAIGEKVKEEYKRHEDDAMFATWQFGFGLGKKEEDAAEHNQEQIHKVRPKRPYLCYMKSQIEGHKAHPETAMRTGNESINILHKLREENPLLNLHGLTLEEYILAGAQVYRLTGKVIDRDYGSESFLLEEKFIAPRSRDPESEQVDFYLQGSSFNSIGSMQADDTGPRRVSRFVVLPENVQ